MKRRNFLQLVAVTPFVLQLSPPNIWQKDKQYFMLYKFNPFISEQLDNSSLVDLGKMAGERAVRLCRDCWKAKPGFPLAHIYIPAVSNDTNNGFVHKSYYDQYAFVGWKTKTGLMDHSIIGYSECDQIILNAFNEIWLNA